MALKPDKQQSQDAQSAGPQFGPMTELERRQAIDKIRGQLASVSSSPGSDADDLNVRVRLLRLWQELLHTRGTDYVDPPGQPYPVEANDQQEVTTAGLGETVDDPADKPIDLPIEVLVEAPAEVAHADLVTAESPPNLATSSNIMEDEAPHSPHETEVLETYGPHKPTLQPHLNDRLRLKLLHESILMNRVLPAGTVVLVYPLDADHLVEQGLAIFLSDQSEDQAQAVDLHEF